MLMTSNVVVGTLLLLFTTLRYFNERPATGKERASLGLQALLAGTLVAGQFLARVTEYAPTVVFCVIFAVLIVVTFTPSDKTMTGRR